MEYVNELENGDEMSLISYLEHFLTKQSTQSPMTQGMHPIRQPITSALKPIAQMPTVDGSKPKPQQFPFKQQQIHPAQFLRPSVSGSVAAEKNDPRAFVLNMFKPRHPV